MMSKIVLLTKYLLIPFGFDRNEMFLGWKTRWPHDGLNDPRGMNYTTKLVEETPLYTRILADIGHPPSSMEVYMMDHSKDVSFWW